METIYIIIFFLIIFIVIYYLNYIENFSVSYKYFIDTQGRFELYNNKLYFLRYFKNLRIHITEEIEKQFRKTKCNILLTLTDESINLFKDSLKNKKIDKTDEVNFDLKLKSGSLYSTKKTLNDINKGNNKLIFEDVIIEKDISFSFLDVYIPNKAQIKFEADKVLNLEGIDQILNVEYLNAKNMFIDFGNNLNNLYLIKNTFNSKEYYLTRFELFSFVKIKLITYYIFTELKDNNPCNYSIKVFRKGGGKFPRNTSIETIITKIFNTYYHVGGKNDDDYILVSFDFKIEKDKTKDEFTENNYIFSKSRKYRSSNSGFKQDFDTNEEYEVSFNIIKTLNNKYNIRYIPKSKDKSKPFECEDDECFNKIVINNRNNLDIFDILGRDYNENKYDKMFTYFDYDSVKKINTKKNYTFSNNNSILQKINTSREYKLIPEYLRKENSEQLHIRLTNRGILDCAESQKKTIKEALNIIYEYNKWNPAKIINNNFCGIGQYPILNTSTKTNTNYIISKTATPCGAIYQTACKPISRNMTLNKKDNYLFHYYDKDDKGQDHNKLVTIEEIIELEGFKPLIDFDIIPFYKENDIPSKGTKMYYCSV